MHLFFLVALFVICLTSVLLTACAWRKGGVRGFLRAGPLQFSVEIDPNPQHRLKDRAKPKEVERC
jgi:hypothetical protein